MRQRSGRDGRHIDIERGILLGNSRPGFLDGGQFAAAEAGGVAVLVKGGRCRDAVSAPLLGRGAGEVQINLIRGPGKRMQLRNAAQRQRRTRWRLRHRRRNVRRHRTSIRIIRAASVDH